MTTALLTDRDLRTRKFVTQQLEWDPAVEASAIGVAARDGAVTLTGYVNSYAEKLAAERAAKRVHGVRAVANDIEVRLKIGRTDADIAADVAMALRIHASIPAAVQATVHHGHVTLTGTVSWLYQKTLAEKAREWRLSVPETVMRILSTSPNVSVMNRNLYDVRNAEFLARQEWMMTCTDGGTPVTMDMLFGLVKLGTVLRASR